MRGGRSFGAGMAGRSRIYCYEDARRLARRRLPRIVFDFIDGAAGREAGAAGNERRLDEIKLRSRILVDVAQRRLETKILGKEYSVPFGIAPMGMCGLAGAGADRNMARTARAFNMPVCLSTAGSSTMEDMRLWAGDHAWFQLYFRGSAENTMEIVDRAETAGYDTLVLTVDLPQLSRRPRDLRNGFDLPFRPNFRSFLDFASSPAWSIRMLGAGVPYPRNIGPILNAGEYDRNAPRSGTDWEFLERLRERWHGNLIVKGVKFPEDAIRIKELGADAIYVSNHGGRQFDSEPPAIDWLAPVRQSVGTEFPVIFDSGLRSGEDIMKALALGADFVMLGRPILFAIGAEGRVGLEAMLEHITADLSVAMAQIGVSEVLEIGSHVLHGQPDG